MSSPQEDPNKKIMELDDEHRPFILDEEPLQPNLIGLHIVRVMATEKWLIYRDGLLMKQLGPGPHRWWNGFMHEWKRQRINMRVEIIPLTVKGRVKGPPMPQDVPGAAGLDLACDVTAELDLTCQLADVEMFLKYRNPITLFESSVSNMVVEMIGKLPYDQYGEWATGLRDYIRERLTGSTRDNTERLIGIRVEDVYVKDFKPNTAHDRNMMANYQLVERVRRELSEAQANANRDRVNALSFQEQGKLLNIAPAILALQKSPVGEALIQRDADLRKLAIGAGLNPGVNIQPLQDPIGQLGSGQPSMGYLNPPLLTGPTQGPGSYDQQQPYPPYPNTQQSSGSFYLNAPQVSGSLNMNTQPSAPLAPIDDADDAPIDNVRKGQELEALRRAGFEPAGVGQIVPLYDQNGRPLPGGKEWIIQVSLMRSTGPLMMVFHCPSGYPAFPPRVQIRGTLGGGLRWIEPNVIKDWHVGRLLVEAAQEITNDTP